MNLVFLFPQPTIDPMRSAYGSSESGEPDFTNYSRVKENDPFIDTLDYVFLSPRWEILDVLPLPHRSAANGPFPNLDHGEPSDHVLIGVTLGI
jgi:2',5'-phosphodiesterase